MCYYYIITDNMSMRQVLRRKFLRFVPVITKSDSPEIALARRNMYFDDGKKVEICILRGDFS
jgi:hypothetical protein